MAYNGRMPKKGQPTKEFDVSTLCQKVRIDGGWTQREMTQMFNLRSPETYANWEHGRSEPPVQIFLQLLVIRAKQTETDIKSVLRLLK